MTARRTAYIFVISSLLVGGIAFAATEHSKKPKKLQNLPPGVDVLWTDPGDVASLDLVEGVGGKEGEPAPPFSFVKEDLSGSSPKVTVKDAKDRTWSVKWGPEAMPDNFCTRLVWACGYIVETDYFISHGTITGASDLKRAKDYVSSDGTFANARFQLRADQPKFLENANWSWTYNPFIGTPQLNGLKVLVMLLSNWDTKDARDKDPGAFFSKLADTNLAIFQEKTETGYRYLYIDDDWGASLGRWGGPVIRNKRNCSDYAAQSAGFVKGVDHDTVHFAFEGKHDKDITEGIRVMDVRWLIQYLGRVSDEQIRGALAASGATPEELGCYGSAIRNRIEQLRRVAEGS